MESPERLLDSVFEAVADGVCVTRGEGEIVYLNPAAERILEIPRDRARGQSLCDLLCGRLQAPGCRDCAAACPLKDASGDERAVTHQGRFGPLASFEWRGVEVHRQERWKDLRVRCLRTSAPFLEGPVSDAHLTIIEDASAEASLARHKEQWRHMANHDLRSPLTNIYSVLRLLFESDPGKPLTPSQRELLAPAIRSAQRMVELLNLYLDIAKLDAATMPVRLGSVPLLDLASAAVEEQEGLAREKGVEIEVEVPPRLAMEADEDLLERVLQNLLNNAIKFSPKGGKVEVAAEAAPDGTASLSVKDEGPGIPPEDLPTLFDRFRQLRARREGKAQGTGLGLTFCREAVAAMGGEIVVRSEPGKGAQFRVILPLADREGGAEAS